MKRPSPYSAAAMAMMTKPTAAAALFAVRRAGPAPRMQSAVTGTARTTVAATTINPPIRTPGVWGRAPSAPWTPSVATTTATKTAPAMTTSRASARAAPAAPAAEGGSARLKWRAARRMRTAATSTATITVFATTTRLAEAAAAVVLRASIRVPHAPWIMSAATTTATITAPAMTTRDPRHPEVAETAE